MEERGKGGRARRGGGGKDARVSCVVHREVPNGHANRLFLRNVIHATVFQSHI